MVLKVSIVHEVTAEHGRPTDFGSAALGQTTETLTLHGKILKLRQTGPLDFELSHPSGQISKFKLYDLVEAIGEDLCQHVGHRPADRLP